MARILAVGIATLDIINLVARAPAEDAEIRTISQSQRRGGNATNSLVVLSQLGHQCEWAGVLVDVPSSAGIQADLAHYAVGTQYCERLHSGHMPTSYITLSQETGSRTIVHHRDCPEYSFAAFTRIPLNTFDWVHFEGRDIHTVGKMMRYLKDMHPTLPCSLEIEKPRPQIETLSALAELVLFSKHYVCSTGCASAEDFLVSQSSNSPLVCGWGSAGAYYRHANAREVHHCPAPELDTVIDSVGAGDTLNAAVIAGTLAGKSLDETVRAAVGLASRKCQHWGLDIGQFRCE